MLYSADGRLLSIIMSREQGCEHGFIYLTAIVVQPAVLLFIHGFQLCVEQTENRVAEALRLNGEVFVDSVGRDIFFIDGFFHPGMRVGALCAHARHHFVVFIGNGVSGGNAGNAVDCMINRFPGSRIGGLVVFIIQIGDLTDQRLFLCPVE